jgi:hypothetical protein
MQAVAVFECQGGAHAVATRWNAADRSRSPGHFGRKANIAFQMEELSMQTKFSLPTDPIPDKKMDYEAPELVELGDVAKLTNYDVSVLVP